MSLPFQGRVAIVTGATRGIGRATALQLASLGASITLVFYSRSVEAERLAAEINSSSSASIPRAITIRADVSDPIAVRSVFDLTEKTFKSPPHIVVHSAAIFDRKYQSMSSIPQAIFDSIMSVNAQGAFHVFQEAANRVVPGGGGRIIALSYLPRHGVYACSKAVVEAMVESLANVLKIKRITINCVAAGPAATDMFFAGKTEEDAKVAAENNPMERLGVLEDIASFIYLLCSDAGEMVSGRVIRANGGMI